MRFSLSPRSEAIVVQMAEEEEDCEDDNDKPSSPTEPTGRGGVKIQLAEGLLKPGSWLKGKVFIDQRLPNASNVSITVKGTALTHFPSDDGKQYKSKNDFLSEVIDLGGDIEQRIMLLTQNESNELVLPFQYRLPVDLPPSFIGTYGCISYQCTVIVRFSSALTRRRVSRTQFQVQPKRVSNGSAPTTPVAETPISPEIPPQLRSPGIPSSRSVSVIRTHRMSSFGFSDGTVDIRLETDETNLKRGQTCLMAIVVVTNNTNLHLRDLRFGLMLTTEWNAKGRRITERKIIAEEKQDDFCLRPSKDVQWDKQFPPIPIDLPPTVQLKSDGKGCPLCRCTYVLFAKLVPPNFAETCLVEIPLNVY